MTAALHRSVLIIALAAVAFGGTACRASEQPAASSRETTRSAVATQGAGVTDTLEPLDPTDAEALEKELDAIEKELESLELPGDSDFEDIEGAL